jgi:hypothetical protein
MEKESINNEITNSNANFRQIAYNLDKNKTSDLYFSSLVQLTWMCAGKKVLFKKIHEMQILSSFRRNQLQNPKHLLTAPKYR